MEGEGGELRIVAAKGRRVICRPVRGYELTEEKRALFLEVLGETCNVRRAAAEAGVGRCAFYKLRRRDLAFAAEWDEAMEQGYDELEAELLAKALGDGSVSELARANPKARIALVGGTADEVRRVMIEGDSGLIAVARSGERYRWVKSLGEFHFDSGACGHVFSAASPGRAAELYALRPERVQVECDAGGWPAAYRYRVGSSVTRLSADPVRPEVIHLHDFDPLDDHYGQGCLSAAAGAVAIHNAAARWSKALLDNAARPSGALVYDAKRSAWKTFFSWVLGWVSALVLAGIALRLGFEEWLTGTCCAARRGT